MKIKSLAEEARIIRSEEKRYDGQSPQRSQLRGHRSGIVRHESRAAQLAYGYLRGGAYREMEGPSSWPPPMERVAQLVKKYGDGLKALDGLKDWFAK